MIDEFFLEEHSEAEATEEIYEVGYCKPPKSTQFPKGQSGNPRGRPKKTVTFQDHVQKILQEKVAYNGRTITKQDVIVNALVNQAALGKSKPLDILMRQIEAIEHSHAPELTERDFKILKGLKNDDTLQ